MRIMSFSMTTEAYRRWDKLVTRRYESWKTLKPGTYLMGAEKCQGLKKGEKIKLMHPAQVVSNVPEPLMDIVRYPVRETGIPEVVLEGFPELTPQEFVDMFVEHNGCKPEAPVQRIFLKHLWEMPAPAKVIA